MIGVVIAGGPGTRMSNITRGMPKCLLKIKGKTILDIILEQLLVLDLQEIIVSAGMNYRNINKHTQKYNLPIKLFDEQVPLGSSGFLHFLSKIYPQEVALVFNGDIYAFPNLDGLIDHHIKSTSDLTILGASHSLSLDFGVIVADDQKKLTSFTEKPTKSYIVSSGIYILNLNSLPEEEITYPLDFPELIAKMQKNNKKISVVNHFGKWVDIGTPKRYATLLGETNHNAVEHKQ